MSPGGPREAPKTGPVGSRRGLGEALAAPGNPVRQRGTVLGRKLRPKSGPLAAGSLGPAECAGRGEDPRRGCKSSEERIFGKRCAWVRRMEGKSRADRAGGSHTPYPVGRRIASLIPPAHAASSLPFARGLVVNAALLGSLGTRLGSLLEAVLKPPEAS